MVQPLAERLAEYNSPEANYGEIPVSDLTGSGDSKVGPFRCTRCQGYINLHSKFTNDGQKVTCNLCGFSVETPAEHFGSVDIHGRRVDGNPAYTCGTFEYKVDLKEKS